MKIKTNLVFLILAGLLFFTSLNAQTPDPLDFFPHHQGDVWEYWELEDNVGIIDTVQNKIISDSLGTDGNFYINTTFFGSFILDTLNNSIYTSRGENIALAYKLNANIGETWIVDSIDVGTAQIAKMVDIFSDEIFGVSTTIKLITFFFVNEFNDSLWLGNHYLANGFGIVQEDFELASPGFLIKGAIIDSVKYGAVTAINHPTPLEIPEVLSLYQNYPNPFNPQTTIRYDLHRQNKVELAIYDVLGRKIALLVNKTQPAGSYQVQFDGQGLTSGVYIYQLRTPFVIFAKKMILTQ